MKRFLIAVLGAAVAFATVANAATLVATAPDSASGGTVTITLVGTTDPETETAQSIDVRIVGAGFTSVSAETATGGVCVAGSGCIPGAAYSVGGTQGTTVGGNFVALSQIGGLAAVPLTNNMTVGVPFNTGGSSLTAVFTTIAGAPGTYPITLSSIGAGFFGVTGATQIGSYTVVPEPTTAALMGLGLLGLALSGRRR